MNPTHHAPAAAVASPTSSDGWPAAPAWPSNGFASLGRDFFTEVPTQALPEPRLVAFSRDAATEIGWSPESFDDPALIAHLAGHSLTPAPIATVYSGHQFGVWAGQLGDGRAHLLGEVGAAHQRYEIQLKGAGLTPYSRMGDGRAVLRSSIREFLCAEAMHHLGIATTRSLAVVASPLPVRRETVETAAVVTRLAPSFVRFGHFEHFSSTGRADLSRRLLDHVIDRFYPHCRDAADPVLAFIEAVAQATAVTIARWQAVGFCHGVMNTDNMSILGLTIDYGPFGFLDGFDANHICNHTDQAGRYAFQRQPQVAFWNLYRLGHALLPLLPQGEASIEAARAALDRYKPAYATEMEAQLRAKLGLAERVDDEADGALFDDLFELMHANRADYTLTFRLLSGIRRDSGAAGAADAAGATGAADAVEPGAQAVRDLFADRAGFDRWCDRYRARLALEKRDDASRALAMNRVNPKYVLRNHLAELAIRQAQAGDDGEVRRLLHILERPFDEQPEFAAYAGLPPDWASGLEVSCSS
ncbi:protein adenylyltransferase SelO [Chitinasiproducens palmae]|uniref:Protein nucleotidyltransferase YdiU n=1 Tax=Chitinasiproducens palmae TaxID=1770053 RepID=A0A1H2PVX4_9BURK|nr:YdiU family protein [Chitinasiproducens palmae]SDV51460.1 Uncharacterized conserved protein YdiU, UPF0061 family [Chitinasiproducens palmae]